MARSRPPQASPDPAQEVATATLAASEDQAGSGSSAMTALAILALGLLIGLGCIQLRRYRERRRVAAIKHQRDAAWWAVVHQIEMERSPGPSKPSAEGLEKIDAG